MENEIMLYMEKPLGLSGKAEKRFDELLRQIVDEESEIIRKLALKGEKLLKEYLCEKQINSIEEYEHKLVWKLHSLSMRQMFVAGHTRKYVDEKTRDLLEKYKKAIFEVLARLRLMFTQHSRIDNTELKDAIENNEVETCLKKHVEHLIDDEEYIFQDLADATGKRHEMKKWFRIGKARRSMGLVIKEDKNIKKLITEIKLEANYLLNALKLMERIHNFEELNDFVSVDHNSWVLKELVKDKLEGTHKRKIKMINRLHKKETGEGTIYDRIIRSTKSFLSENRWIKNWCERNESVEKMIVGLATFLKELRYPKLKGPKLRAQGHYISFFPPRFHWFHINFKSGKIDMKKSLGFPPAPKVKRYKFSNRIEKASYGLEPHRLTMRKAAKII